MDIIKDYIKLLGSSQKKNWWVYLLLFTVWIPICRIGIISIYFYANLYLPTSFDFWMNKGIVSYSICTLFFALLTSLPLLLPNYSAAQSLKQIYKHKKVRTLTFYNHSISLLSLFILGLIYFQLTIF